VFIGRRKELREFGQILASGRQRQLLITGPGGQGKTALAGKLARKLEQQGYLVHAYSARPSESSWDNFIFNLKSSLSDQLLEQVERRWGLCPNELQQAQLLLNALKQQGPLVLLFDNLESVQDAKTGELTDATLQTWLQAAQKLPKVVILLTSRWAVPGIESHPLARPSYGDFLRYIQYLNLDLTRERKRELYPVLGGNFKGLQLFQAAQQLGIGQAAFLERVRTAQRDLQVYMAVELVVGYLQSEERVLLERLPVYATPVTELGVRRIAGDLVAPVEALRRLVGLALVDVEVVKIGKKRQRAYQISPLVTEWLQWQGGEKPALELRRLAAEHQKWLFEHGLDTFYQAITVHEALQLAELQEEANHLALDRLVPYFDIVGMYRTLLDKWLPTLRKSGDKKTQAEAINKSGEINYCLSNYDTAMDYYQQSLQIRWKIGDRAGEGTTLNNISQIYHDKGDYETALDYLQQSLKIRRKIGDRAGEGTTLNNISQIYHDKGNYETALDYLQQVLKIMREIGDRKNEGGTLNNISALYHAQSDYETALDYLQQSLQIRREIGDRAGEGTTLGNISRIYHAKGDYETELDYIQQSLKIFREIGDRASEGTALNNISQIYDAKGDYETALDYLQQSLQICREIGVRAGEGTILNNISTLYHARGDYETALDYLQQSLQISREIGDRAGESTTLNNISALYHARGDYETALDYLQQSLKIRRKIGDLAGSCNSLFNMGANCWQTEKQKQAYAHWLNAYAIAKKIGHAEALANLESLAKQLGGDGLEFWDRLGSEPDLTD
jgi:tetratricopeptide (TPR) repeat protein